MLMCLLLDINYLHAKKVLYLVRTANELGSVTSLSLVPTTNWSPQPNNNCFFFFFAAKAAANKNY